MDPDADEASKPGLFVSDLQDAKQKFSLSFYAHSFWKVHLHHSSKVKSHKEITKK
jgi:hypothetical protein